MGKGRVYSADSAAIIDRYFLAVDKCIEIGMIKNVRQWLIECDIVGPQWYCQRRERGRGHFQAGWLTPLVEQCSVSAVWLLTGRGTMFA